MCIVQSDSVKITRLLKILIDKICKPSVNDVCANKFMCFTNLVLATNYLTPIAPLTEPIIHLNSSQKVQLRLKRSNQPVNFPNKTFLETTFFHMV